MSAKPEIFVFVENKFPLGQMVITAGAKGTLSQHDIETAINSHASGNWGDVGQEDWSANERALTEGTRLLSIYESETGVRFYVITEWDRSVTTILLPEEY